MNQEEHWLLEEKYRGEKCEAFLADCVRLKAGEPLAYVIGHIPFLDCRIYLDSHPLIPRPETEYWTAQAIGVIQDAAAASPQPLTILDLGAGSGAIGVAVASALPDSYVTFAELDPTHLPTIKHNLRENLSIDRKVWEERMTVLQSDLFTAVAGTFDFILTNPPYIDPAIDRTEAAVKAYEPHSALYGGQDGMELIQKIITAGANHLNPHGQLWLEHEPEQAELIHSLGESLHMHTTTHTDQYGQNRFSVLTMAK